MKKRTFSSEAYVCTMSIPIVLNGGSPVYLAAGRVQTTLFPGAMQSCVSSGKGENGRREVNKEPSVMIA